MSSLAAVRAYNFYYLSEWDPSQGSLNKFHGQHALRERKDDRSGYLDFKEEDLKKKKEAEPVLNQKKRVAEEQTTSRKSGLGIRLLPSSEQDVATVAKVKFSSKFEKNRKDKRALMNVGSIFPGLVGSSTTNKRRVKLESKRRKICASEACRLLIGGFKPSSWSRGCCIVKQAK